MTTKTLIWEHNQDYRLYTDILEIVEPHEKERNAIIECLKQGICYRSYLARDETGFVVAICIATILPKTQTLHIEDFALHPKIRGLGLAKYLWDEWRKLVRETWTEIEAISIEVYLQNVAPWRKIMNIYELFPEPLHLLPFAPDILMMFMGKNIASNAEEILKI